MPHPASVQFLETVIYTAEEGANPRSWSPRYHIGEVVLLPGQAIRDIAPPTTTTGSIVKILEPSREFGEAGTTPNGAVEMLIIAERLQCRRDTCELGVRRSSKKDSVEGSN